MREQICRPKKVLQAKNFQSAKPIYFYLKYTHDAAISLEYLFLYFQLPKQHQKTFR